MIKTFKPFMALLALSLNCLSLHAQNSDNDQKSTDENIIIHKKDSVKEKITVVIDGNNITLNGKPIDDFTSNDIDIIKQKQDMGDNDVNVFGYGDMQPLSPRAPQVKIFRDDMMRKIKSNTAFLGVMTDKTDKGAKITDVTEGSAAEKAGLKESDVIIKIGDDKVAGPDDLYKVVGKHKPDEKIAITYLRSGKQATANATLGKADQMKVYSWNAPGNFNNDFNKDFNRNFSFSYDSDKPHLGISAQDIEDGNGVKILDIDDDDSPAAKAGLKEDDVITQVNGKTITSTEDLKESVKDVKKGDTVKITFKRNNQTQTVAVKFPKDLKTIDL
ncbi:MAG: PDZ domain-containing protein [Parafilimonas sp.]